MNDKIVIADCFALFNELFAPQVLLQINDSKLMLVKIKGDEIPWHSHVQGDELFWVLSGRIVVWTREGTITLNSGELYKVPKGVEHRVTATELAKVVLIESNTFLHTGSVKSDITKITFNNLLDVSSKLKNITKVTL